MHVVPLPGDLLPLDVAARIGERPGFLWCAGTPGYGEEGRWSFLGSDPVEVVSVPYGDPEPLSALSALDGEVDHAPDPDGTIPPPGRVPRWAGYIAYDAHWSGRERRLRDSLGLPVLWFGRYDALVAVDHLRGRAFILGDDHRCCSRLRRRLDGAPHLPVARSAKARVAGRSEHARAIEAALEYIAAGDIYQVNLARCWTARFEGSPLALWLRMREASPVPLGLYVAAGDHAVLSCTMERFLGFEGPGKPLYTRPIKGTIARSGSRDASEARQLRSDDKERAEHAMIVDLMRNDLGRVARIGSVEVTGMMKVEPYARLSHLVSTVRCVTRPGVSLGDVMRATFPPGSVTGAPKLRAIDIIEELERVPRGIYTGTVGYTDRGGGASFAVAIRTAVVSDGSVCYYAGGGLVAASDTGREIAETELKARVFLDALSGLERLSRPRFPVGSYDFALNSAP
jgi:anthranilate/para-aminobenzoate synthase component I